MPRLNPIASAMAAGALADVLSSVAWAQETSQEAFKHEMALEMLSLREAITEVCTQHFPQDSAVMQAQWQAKLRDPAAQARIQSPDSPKRLVDNRSLARSATDAIQGGSLTPEQKAALN